MEPLPLDIIPSAFPVRRRSARTYLAGSELVVASGRTGEALALNETASALWERCDGSQSVEAIVATLAAAFGRPPGDIVEAVRGTLADFHGRGLVDLHAGGSAPGPQRERELGDPFYVTFLQHTVEVRTDDRGVAKNIERIFGGLLGEGGGARVGHMSVLASGDGFRVVKNGVESAPQPTLRAAVTWLKKRTVRALIEARPDLLWLHAGAVSKGERVLFCLGQGGSGKSTTVMALVEEGWAYLSDDVVAYDPVTGGALAFPLAPFYRIWGDELVDDINVLDKVRFQSSPSLVTSAALTVSALVFPVFSPDGAAVCTPRGAAAAAVGLSDQCLNHQGHRGDALHAFADLAGRAPAYDITHTPDTPPVELVRPLVEW